MEIAVYYSLDLNMKTTPFTYEYIYNYFKERNCKLLSTNYKNSSTKLQYVCKCGNIVTKTFNKFKYHNYCKECNFKNLQNKFSFDFKYVKEYIEKNNYILLSDKYINNREKLELKCPNDHIIYICFDKFKGSGRRCKKCHYNSIYGEGHPRWVKNRNKILDNNLLRKNIKKSWIIKNMKDDLNYNNYILNSNDYEIDHIIPINAFSKLLNDDILYDRTKLKEIANNIENLQLLNKKENKEKSGKHSQKDLIDYIDKYYYNKCTI